MEQALYPVIDRSMNLMDLKAYYARLKAHDWFYDMSDDKRARRKGQEEQSKIAYIADTAAGEYAALFDGFSAHYSAIVTAREDGAVVPPLPKEPT